MDAVGVDGRSSGGAGGGCAGLRAGTQNSARDEEVGRCIPKDLAVVGYGNLNSGLLLTPQLTTYNIPIEEMCYATVDLLVKLITNAPISKKVIEFNGELVIRDSV